MAELVSLSVVVGLVGLVVGVAGFLAELGAEVVAREVRELVRQGEGGKGLS